MKNIIKKICNVFKYEIRKKSLSLPGSNARPIGNVRSFLEDVSARGFSPRGIIDVGANHGNWTKLALAVFPEATYVMIEPQDEMETILNEFCRKSAKLNFVKAGAGKENGELIQTIWTDLAGTSFLPKIDEKMLASGKQRRTKIVTIDSLLNDFPSFHPDLVKLDVQGFEIEVLKGAKSIFGKTELFIMETSLYEFMPGQPTTKDCINFMNENGYEFYDVTEYSRRPFDGALGQIDLAFAKMRSTHFSYGL